MRPSGILLVIAGTLVLCQIFGGDALGRLGIIADASSTSGSSAKPPDGATTGPAPGTGSGGGTW